MVQDPSVRQALVLDQLIQERTRIAQGLPSSDSFALSDQELSQLKAELAGQLASSLLAAPSIDFSLDQTDQDLAACEAVAQAVAFTCRKLGVEVPAAAQAVGLAVVLAAPQPALALLGRLTLAGRTLLGSSSQLAATAAGKVEATTQAVKDNSLTLLDQVELSDAFGVPRAVKSTRPRRKAAPSFGFTPAPPA